MSKLNLSVAIGDYDRNRPLIDGAVQIDGVDPIFMTLLAGGNLLPRVPQRGLRHLRMLAVELHGQDRGRQLPLCRRAGVRVADVPPHLDLCAHRPHQEAGRPQGQEGRRAGVSAHRQRLGARDPGGRLRRQAEGHPLDPRRHRARRPAGEDHASSCRRACGSTARRKARPSPSCWPRARSTASSRRGRRPRSRRAERRLAVPRSGRGGEGLLQAHLDLPDHAPDRRAQDARREASLAAGGGAQGVRAVEGHGDWRRCSTPRRPRSRCRSSRSAWPRRAS